MINYFSRQNNKRDKENSIKNQFLKFEFFYAGGEEKRWRKFLKSGNLTPEKQMHKLSAYQWVKSQEQALEMKVQQLYSMFS